MHNFPCTVFRSKDHRSPQSEWGDFLPFANLALKPLYLYDIGKLRSHVLRYDLEASGYAISASRCGPLHGLSNLLPPTHGRTLGVSEGYVVSMREQPLRRLGVSFDELTRRWVILLNYFVKIIYRSHLDITFIVGTSSFPTAMMPSNEP
jgi:hypothetical protein